MTFPNQKPPLIPLTPTSLAAWLANQPDQPTAIISLIKWNLTRATSRCTGITHAHFFRAAALDTPLTLPPQDQ